MGGISDVTRSRMGRRRPYLLAASIPFGLIFFFLFLTPHYNSELAKALYVGLMFALGCIQSRQCNANTCPTGVATQDPRRYKHLHIEDKARRVAHYHRSTVHALLELVATTGLDTPSQVEPKHLLHRVNGPDIRSYAELYPGIIEGCLIHPEAAPADWQRDWRSEERRVGKECRSRWAP